MIVGSEFQIAEIYAGFSHLLYPASFYTPSIQPHASLDFQDILKTS